MKPQKYKTLLLGEPTVFEFINKKTTWTKEYYSKLDTRNVNDYPVYTASKEPVAFVNIKCNELINADSEHPVISLGANGDGSAGTNLVFHQRPFYISNDRTCIRVINKKVRAEYVFYKLLNIKSQYGFDFQFKATPKNLKPLVEVSIPINGDGEFDPNAQYEVEEKYKKFLSFREGVHSYIEALDSGEIMFSVEGATKTIPLSDSNYFDLKIGDRVLKKDHKKEGIPVYSANVKQPFGYIEKTNLKDFTKPALLWGIDGIFEWSYLPAGEIFATTDHCGTVYLKSKDLDPEYVYYALNGTREQYGFDRTYRASLENMKSVVTVTVPVDSNGNFNIKEQRKIAEKQKKLQFLRKALLEQLEQLSTAQITFD